jgi:hypothetical protein
MKIKDNSNNNTASLERPDIQYTPVVLDQFLPWNLGPQTGGYKEYHHLGYNAM